MRNVADEYVAGTCNIGGAEVRRRLALGWTGLLVCVLLLAMFIFSNADARWRLILFFPALLSAMGFLQARRRFCVAYGFAGVYNVKPGFQAPENVEQAEFRGKDRRTALVLTCLAVFIGLAVALAAYNLPR